MAEVRRKRIDGARNRETLLAAATLTFSSSETEPSMRSIAREAGVSVGTLFRHFPTREALVDAIYRDQVQRLTVGARDLLKTVPPAAAMRKWMDLFGEWLATKRGMLSTLLAMIDAGAIAHTETRTELLSAISVIVEAGSAAGDIRSDVSVEDIAASLFGVFTVTATPEQRAQCKRLLDLLMDGLRPRQAEAGRATRAKGAKKKCPPHGPT